MEPTDAYQVGSSTGSAKVLFTSDYLSDLNCERYTVFIGNYDSGTGNGSVPASTYGLGVSALKKDWEGTTRKGQMHGISIVTRGGFHGVDEDGDYSGTPGDSAAIVTNSVVSDADSYVAGAEGVAYYAPNGGFGPGAVGIRYQIAGIAKNKGFAHGYLAIAEIGQSQVAFLAGNTPGSSWERAIQYSPDLGGGGYDAFVVNKSGHIVMSNGPSAVAPNTKKTIRVESDGSLGIVNSANTAVIFSLDDQGNIHLPAGAGVYIGGTKVL